MKGKRLLSLVLALAMILGTFSFVSAASDVEGTVYEDAVDRLELLGILEGYPDGTFKPDNEITRAEFAAVVIRAKGLEDAAIASKGLASGFTDVPADHWASGYVGIAAKLGIVNGIGNNLFAPGSPVKYEEAVTMVMRALGYEPAAQARGGYPFGNLIVGTEIGLLDHVRGVQGTPAVRGSVAQIVDNALEIPLMIQVGYGTDSKYVVSGSKEHGDNAEEKYLLDEMGFDSIKGRVESVNTKTNKIVVAPKDEKKETLKVEKGFDFYEVEGLTTKFWHKDDLVIVYAVTEEAKYDAVKYDEKDEVTLVAEDENYEVNKDAILTLDGDSVKVRDLEDFNADYAKIVLNDDDEIVWAKGYRLNGFILVEEVKDNVAYSFDDYDELKIKDYTVVKDGKTIGIDGIEEEDILFYNTSEEFAVVYNNGEEGELDRVYSGESFRFEGSAYDYSDLGAIYFDDGKIGDLDDKILDDFLDDEATITVYVDFRGDAVVVAGEVSSVGDSAYHVLLKDAHKYDGRREELLALDMRNGEGEKVSYDIPIADLDGDIKLEGITAEELEALEADNDEVLKISVDKDGDVTKIELPESETVDVKSFEIDDANVKADGVNYRLQANTIVFHDGKDKATTLGNAKGEFAEVKENSKVYYEKGRVVAVVGETDADADTKTVVGLVTDAREMTNGKLQFTVKVFGVTERLVTESKSLLLGDYSAYKNTIRGFKVGETSGEIKEFADPDEKEITVYSISGRTIKGSPQDVELNRNAVIYNEKQKEINLRDIEEDDVITVYFQGSSKRFVDYVVVGEGEHTPPAGEGTVTYINVEENLIEVDGEVLELATRVRLVDADGKTVEIGKDKVVAKLAELDEEGEVVLTEITSEDGIVTEMKLAKVEEEEPVEPEDEVTWEETPSVPLGLRMQGQLNIPEGMEDVVVKVNGTEVTLEADGSFVVAIEELEIGYNTVTVEVDGEEVASLAKEVMYLGF